MALSRPGGHTSRARPARADIITAVRSKIAAAGVQPFNRAAVTNDPPIRVKRQPPVGAAVEKEQPFVPIDGKAAWIGNAAVTLKAASDLPLSSKNRSVPSPIPFVPA